MYIPGVVSNAIGVQNNLGFDSPRRRLALQLAWMHRFPRQRRGAQEKGARTDTAERGNALREREAHVLRPPKIEGNLPAHMLDFEMYVFFFLMQCIVLDVMLLLFVSCRAEACGSYL